MKTETRPSTSQKLLQRTLQRQQQLPHNALDDDTKSDLSSSPTQPSTAQHTSTTVEEGVSELTPSSFEILFPTEPL